VLFNLLAKKLSDFMEPTSKFRASLWVLAFSRIKVIIAAV
jgi:hypothetical protein